MQEDAPRAEQGSLTDFLREIPYQDHGAKPIVVFLFREQTSSETGEMLNDAGSFVSGKVRFPQEYLLYRKENGRSPVQKDKSGSVSEASGEV